jgi:glycosyltransferase involved in cell wall biosynthesis
VPDPDTDLTQREDIVSFVVIAYNEAAGIRKTIDSILTQVPSHACEVLVVDDGSQDETAAIVTAIGDQDPRVRLVALGRNRGRGFARHRGVEASRGALIAHVDADIVLPPDWLDQALRAIQSHDAVAGRAMPDGDGAYLSRRFRLTSRPVAGSIEVTGNNALYKASVFDKVQFDGALREGEDVALNHALDAVGLRLHAIPGLFVRHEENKTFLQALSWMYVSGLGASRQLRRYRQIRPPDLIFFGFWALVASLPALPTRRRWLRAAIPSAYVLGAAAGHVNRAFLYEGPGTFAAAVIVDAAHVTAYFAGRTVGSVKAPGS